LLCVCVLIVLCVPFCVFCFIMLFCELFVCQCVLYCTVLYCTVPYCTVPYCTALYCTVLVPPGVKPIAVSKYINTRVEAVCKFRSFTIVYLGLNSSVGIATHYGMDDRGFESRWGRDFPLPSRPVLGPTQPPIRWLPGLSRGSSCRGLELTTNPYWRRC
jgi:hypothetical protein